MEQNPISILVVLAGMAFLFLGLMQYSVSSMKTNDTRRQELLDKLQELQLANSALKIERAELLELIEDYKKTVRKYHNFSSHILAKYKDLKNKTQTVVEG